MVSNSHKAKTRRRGWGSVRRLPSGRWQARYWDSARGRSLTAPTTFENKASADRWLAQKRTDLDRGVAVDDREALKPLRDWWPAYRRSIETRGLRPSTILLYEQAWRRIDSVLGTVPVSRIVPSRIDDWIADLCESGLSAMKIRETVGVLRRVLDLAVGDGAISRNPCTGRRLALPRIPRTERHFLSAAEIEELVACFARPTDRVLVQLLAYGGLRIGEALALRRRDLDLVRGFVHVCRSVSATNGVTETKTGHSRPVPLAGLLLKELRQMLESSLGGPDSPLFPSRNGRERAYRNFRRDTWDPAMVRYQVSRTDRGMEPLKLTPHDLRSACASLLVDLGHQLPAVQQHLGHADVTTTLRVYTRVNPDRGSDIARSIDELIQAYRQTPSPGDRFGPGSPRKEGTA